MAQPSDPHVLDQPWRIWATITVFSIMLAGILLGVVVIPVVQGRSDGIDAFTAICRALGILPGSPARQQVSDLTPPSPVSQVVWTSDVLQFSPMPGRNEGRRRRRRFAFPVTVIKVSRSGPQFPHLPVNRAQRSISS